MCVYVFVFCLCESVCMGGCMWVCGPQQALQLFAQNNYILKKGNGSMKKIKLKELLFTVKQGQQNVLVQKYYSFADCD